MDQKKNHFKVFYSDPALHDLENIIDYLNQFSTTVSHGFLAHLEKSVDQLSQFPRIGTHAKFKESQKAGYRFLI